MADVSGRFTPTSKWLHWLTALAIVIAFAMGWVMVDIHGLSPTKLKLFNWHKWIGIVALALACARSIWILLFRAPPLPDSLTVIEQRAAHAMHYLLYFICIAVPLSGYVYTLAAGYPVVLFGQWPLPVFMDPHPEWKEALRRVHEVLSYVLGSAVLLHAMAALHHHFFARDEVLSRMLPQRSAPK